MGHGPACGARREGHASRVAAYCSVVGFLPGRVKSDSRHRKPISRASTGHLIILIRTWRAGPSFDSGNRRHDMKPSMVGPRETGVGFFYLGRNVFLTTSVFISMRQALPS